MLFLAKYIGLLFLVVRNVYSESIRLSGGSYAWEGRVEVYMYHPSYGWTWGTVCDDGFDINDAAAACRSLGYAGAVRVQSYGEGTGYILLDDCACTGTESALWYCSHPAVGVHNCGHAEDVGIVCDSNYCSYFSPCVNGAACSDTVGSFICSCVAGYSGTTCQTDINECGNNPCVYGTCTDLVNQYSCSCNSGYTSTNCDIDIDECSQGICEHGSACSNTPGSYYCTCLSGYTGTHCETDINECNSGPCYNGAVCNDGVNGYTCSCVTGYTDTLCETNIDECASSPCVNDAVCLDDVNQYSCQCVPGTEGTHCETDTDECASNPCQNEGTCTDQLNGYYCTCDHWYYTYNCASLDNSYTHSTFDKFPNSALIGYTYATARVRSDIECLLKCAGMSECQATNYMSESKTCEIISTTKSDHIADYITLSTSTYYEYNPN